MAGSKNSNSKNFFMISTPPFVQRNIPSPFLDEREK